MKKMDAARYFFVFVFLILSWAIAFAGDESMQCVLKLPPSEGNPRNSEGDLIRLADGRLLLVYTHFTSGAGDHAAAYLAGRYSSDGGRTWSREDATIVANQGKGNIMSVSLLRLRDNRIALFYLRKESLADCRPLVRFSTDEAKTWSKPRGIIPDAQVGYYVLNNDRVVQLETGRLVVPVARHETPGGRWTRESGYGAVMCYLSDDAGRTWRRSKTLWDGKPSADPKGGRITLQEPGVVALKGGRLMMFCRTHSGCQYLSFSGDAGETWTCPEPSSIMSPCSPATIERIPATGHLLMVWNDHKQIDPALKNKRTPLCAALSRDEGRTWKSVKTLESNPHGWYCYTAMCFVEDSVLLWYCAGDRRKNNGLAMSQIVRFPVKWLYAQDPEK